MSNKTKLIISSIATLAPGVVFAQGLSRVTSLINEVSNIVTGTLPRLFFGLALVYFFYSLGQYVLSIDDKTKQSAKTQMIYGIIILFVMSSIWGIVNLIQTSTGTQGGQVTVPTI